MVASVLTYPSQQAAWEELLRVEPGDLESPERRLVVCGTSWERYLAFDEQLGV